MQRHPSIANCDNLLERVLKFAFSRTCPRWKRTEKQNKTVRKKNRGARLQQILVFVEQFCWASNPYSMLRVGCVGDIPYIFIYHTDCNASPTEEVILNSETVGCWFEFTHHLGDLYIPF